MYDFCLDALQKLGVVRRRLRYEANGPTAKLERLHDWPNQLDPATAVVVNVYDQDKFTALCGEPLLNSLERPATSSKPTAGPDTAASAG